nr:2OG-Fe(II) oxygenase [uncultured Rhodoferax sp.]
MDGLSNFVVPHLQLETFLSDDERVGLLDWALQNRARFEPSGVNSIIDSRARSSLSLRDLGPFSSLFRDRVRSYAASWIAQLRVTPFDPHRIELELVANKHGSFFTIHNDCFGSDHLAQGNRLITAVYYFHREPKAFSGGELRLHHLGAKAGDCGRDIVPLQGCMIVFPAWWPHEVIPVTCLSGDFSDSRFNVNCWIHGKNTSIAPA